MKRRLLASRLCFVTFFPNRLGSASGALSALAACASLAFALTPAWASETATSSSNTANAASAPAFADDAQLLKQFESLDWASERLELPEPLVRALAQSEPLQTAALEKFRYAPSDGMRYNLLNFLSSTTIPAVSSKALQWVSQSSGSAERASGYLLVSQLRNIPQLDSLAQQALFNEREPVVLAAALRCLQRSTVPTPALASAVVKRLHALTIHTSPDVRIQAIQRLADWDKGLRYVQADVLRLMSDKNSEVRMSAIGASSIASLQTAPVKRRLLHMAADTREQEMVRGVALMNLDRFEFSQREFEQYERVRQQLSSRAE